MAIDMIENSDLGALARSRHGGNRNFINDGDNGYANFLGVGEGKNGDRKGDEYNEAKGKYPFTDSFTCQQLQDLRDKISVEIDQQEVNSHSANYKKKDQKVQADAAQGYSQYRSEIEDQLKKIKCGDQQMAEAEKKDAEKIAAVISGAQQAATTSADQVGRTVASGTNLIIYIVSGIAFFGIVGVIIYKMKHRKT